MEAVFLLLSGVILLAGVLYWFWSHIQLTQKKVQLLENAVFELRGLLNNTPPPASSTGSSSGSGSGSAYEDLPDDADDWSPEDDGERVVETVSTPLEHLMPVYGDVQVEHLGSVNDDLMPGGRIEHVAEEQEKVDEKEIAVSDGDFRELFAGRDATSSPVRTPESLDSMPVKELRRLAEQRGIAGAADMRKKEILAALRKQIQPVAAVAETVVQKTLDLTEEEEAPAGETVEAEILE
jgi:hypothetical protein